MVPNSRWYGGLYITYPLLSNTLPNLGWVTDYWERVNGGIVLSLQCWEVTQNSVAQKNNSFDTPGTLLFVKYPCLAIIDPQKKKNSTCFLPIHHALHQLIINHHKPPCVSVPNGWWWSSHMSHQRHHIMHLINLLSTTITLLSITFWKDDGSHHEAPFALPFIKLRSIIQRITVSDTIRYPW